MTDNKTTIPTLKTIEEQLKKKIVQSIKINLTQQADLAFVELMQVGESNLRLDSG